MSAGNFLKHRYCSIETVVIELIPPSDQGTMELARTSRDYSDPSESGRSYPYIKASVPGHDSITTAAVKDCVAPDLTGQVLRSSKEPLARGGYSIVWKGVWRPEASTEHRVRGYKVSTANRLTSRRWRSRSSDYVAPFLRISFSENLRK